MDALTKTRGTSKKIGNLGVNPVRGQYRKVKAFSEGLGVGRYTAKCRKPDDNL